MEADEIRRWSDRYDEVYDEDIREIENRLNDLLPEQDYITRKQLEDVSVETERPTGTTGPEY